MTNFPNQIDTDLELPPVYDNIVEIGDVAINALRAAMFAVEETLGINPQGSMPSVADRLNVSLEADGTLKPSAIAGLGLVVLPITNSQVSATADIDESKLNLTYTTQFLHDLFTNLDTAVTILKNFNSVTGIKVEPHVAGTGFRHKLSHIDVDAGTLNRINLSAGTLIGRNLTNAYTFAAEVSNDLLAHIRADNLSNTTAPPANQAHNASAIYINPTNFASVPQTANDLQSFAEYVDSSSLVLLGSRTQNLFSNGVPVSTRNTSLTNSKAAEALVDPVPATTYLLFGSATSPVDDIDHGDDVILLNPSSGVLATNNFDAQFSQVKPGDYITINYGNGSVPVTFTIDSTRKFLNGSSRVYLVRINGKNLYASTDAVVRIDRAFYHDTQFNSLALAAANNDFAETPSLVVSNPSGAAVMGIGFDPEKLDIEHYNLYLKLYPTGNPAQKSIDLAAIDVTGDAGISPGKYTLESVVETINNKFRDAGFNYRFIAFSRNGELGIALADRYNHASFSIISGTVDGYGNYTSTSNSSFPNNVVDNYNGVDPLGFGFSGANVASPSFTTTYSTPATALASPTVILSPLKKNFFYVDGVERDGFALEEFTTKDGYGDGYWLATLITKQIIGSRVEVTYEVPLDLCTTGLKKGKTIVVQPAIDFNSVSYDSVDYGRFIIKNVAFNNCPGPSSTTTITVYDAIHGIGTSPFPSSENIPVKLYFCDDSVSFNIEHVSDPNTYVTFKRFFETYINSSGKTFTHERARFNRGGTDIAIDTVNGFTLYSSPEMSVINLVNVSPKLRGYSFGQYKKISLVFNTYDETTGVFDGYLCKFEAPSTYARLGPVTIGKKGEIVRFYDETNVDYIDVSIALDLSVSSFANKKVDIQLFPTLQLNQEKMLLGTCQLDDTTKSVSYLSDRRQFGNVSEKQLSTSALDYIAAPQRLLDENGVVKGFDLTSSDTMTNDNEVSLRGGTALVNGKIVHCNEVTLNIPIVLEALFPAFSTTVEIVKWYICVNMDGEYEFVASTDYGLDFDSTYGALDHDRIFYAKNPASTSGDAYAIRSGYLQKIVLENKDILPLYSVYTEVGLDGSDWKILEASVLDIRRYVEQGYRGFNNPFILSKTGSFRNLKSVSNYIQELTENKSYRTNGLNALGKTVYVRDTFDISGFEFDFRQKVKFIGDNGKFTVSSSTVTLDRNVTFENMLFDVTLGTGFNIRRDDIGFTNCEFSYNYDGTADGTPTFESGQLGNVTKACIRAQTGLSGPNDKRNITIDGCKFTSTTAARYPFVALILNGNEHYYENISITNNRIETTAVGDDKRAAIVISNISTSTPDHLVLGPRVVNCEITNNICNKNQLIMFSASSNGSSVVANMITPVNVSIERNICGAICYLTRQDNFYNTVNDTVIADKTGILLIANNVCRYIYCGTNTGFINVVGSSNRVINDIITSANVYSSSVVIEKNTCSWIHIGVKNPTSYAFETPMIEIAANKLTAYDATFLNDYHSVISPNNIGLIVDSVVGT